MFVSEVLRDLQPTPAGYLKAARELESGPPTGLRPINVAILATFTAEFLRSYLMVESAKRGLEVKLYVAPFNQLEQQILNQKSPLYTFQPDVVVMAARLEEVAPVLTHRFLSLSKTAMERAIEEVQHRLRGLIEGLRQHRTALVLIFNYAVPAHLAAGLADPTLEQSQTSVIQRCNDALAQLCRSYPDVFVFNYARLLDEWGLWHWSDPKLWYLARVPFSAEAQLHIARRLARYLRAMYRPACKCLVLDLDNTLWGGVLGEDGLGGIALGEDYPGNVYKAFQQYLLTLRDRGILLAVASKNDEAEVLEVLKSHPDAVLKLQDFSAIQIHWCDKAASLTAIANELNIGTDALAFFDDNQVELEWIRSQMPEVTVIDAPSSPLGFIEAVEESGAFDQLTVSVEDRWRAELYQGEQVRKQLQTQSLSLDEFCHQLEITTTVGRVDVETLPRVAQLIAKTNQFNLTTRRHTTAEVQTMIASGAIALWLRVTDRFGDYGLVGVAIAVPAASGQWVIDTFLLSCRVIGRRVETVLLGMLSRLVRERGGTTLIGEYRSTSKNTPASTFYADHGFEAMDGDGGRWFWDLTASGAIPLPEMMKVNVESIPRR